MNNAWNWAALSKHAPIEDVLRNPTLQWNRDHLSENRGITLDIKRRLDSMHTPRITGEWDWGYLCWYVPIEDVLENPEEPWRKNELSWNRGITLDIKRKIDTLDIQGDWLWNLLSQNIPMEDVLRNPEEPWNRAGLSQNSGMSLDISREIDTLNVQGEWKWKLLSQNIPIEEVLRNPALPWDRVGLSLNPGITIDAGKRLDIMHVPRATGGWDWLFISMSVPIEDVLTYPRKPWDKKYVPMNRGITMDIMHRIDTLNIQGEWDWHILSRNIPMDDVRANPEEPWCRYGLSYNPGITIEDVKYL